MAKNVIGIAGVARAGKDTFATILINKLVRDGHRVNRIALADALKGDCDAFCQQYLGISAFTQVLEEKTLIRPLLVWYGDAQRKRTNGRYWINIAQKKIDTTDYDYYVITDIRYSHYEKDEGQWIQEECQGVICHVSKFELQLGKVPYKKFVPPPNDHEALNDPKIKKIANYIVEWPHVATTPNENLLDHPSLNQFVDDFMLFQARHFQNHRPLQKNSEASIPAL